MKRSQLRGRAFMAAGVLNASFAVVLFQSPEVASAQESLKYCLANETAVQTNQLDLESLPYTFKADELRLLITPSLEADWNDNVTLSQNNTIQDYIVRPMVQFDGSYPINPQNLLQLNVGVGYDFYTEHSEYSALRVQSGSQISYDSFIKDFRINVHENFQYIQDPAEEASVAATGRYGGLDNTAGCFTVWDLDNVFLSLGYDHRNFVSSSSGFAYLDLASELVLARAGFKVLPTLIMGVEAGASFTTYDQTVFNDNNAYNAGLFADWKPGSYFELKARAGYVAYLFRQTSQTNEALDQYTMYGDVTATHNITDAISYSLSAGHEIRLGSSADFIKDWYVRSSLNWHFRNFEFTPHISFENGQQGQPDAQGNFAESYNWIETGINLSQQITKNLLMSLEYRLTLRTSTVAARSYDQNFVGLSLAYTFD